MRPIITLFIFLLALFSIVAGQVTIQLHSIGNSRGPSRPGADPGYTLDGIHMTGSRAKLQNANNFGSSGTYSKSVQITDGWQAPGSLGGITSSSNIDMLYFGIFDPGYFTEAELDSLYQWSLRGGKLIIGSASPNPAVGFSGRVLNTRWGFELALRSPTSVIPTTVGSSSLLFNGPFGLVSSANQGGGSQGYFTTHPTDIISLADDGNGHVTIYLDCNTLDLVVVDGDVFTGLGGITSGGIISSNNDKIWANAITYMDSLNDVPPTISQVGNMLMTDVYATHQWLLNGTPIPGATNNSYAMTMPGTYSIRVLLPCGCISEVTHTGLGFVGIDDLASDMPVTIFPNPVHDILNIQGIERSSDVQAISLHSISGSLILQEDPTSREVDVSTLPGGVYLLKIDHQKGRKVVKFVKY